MMLFTKKPCPYEYQVYFESKLAEYLMQQTQKNTAVQLVSKAIVDLIDNSTKEIEATLSKSSSKTKELLFVELKNALSERKYVGLFLEKEIKDVSDSSTLLQDIKAVLMDENSKLPHVIAIHSTFSYSVIQNLKTDSRDYAALYKKAYVDDSTTLYNEIQFKSSIIEKAKEVPLTTQNGIFPLSSKEMNSKLSQCAQSHKRAVDENSINREKHAKFIELVFGDKNVPVVSGSSRHALSILSGMSALGFCKPEQFEEYAFYYAAYLTNFGNHSFHEVMRIVSFPNFNGRYLVNQYQEYLDQTPFSKSEECGKLMHEFEDCPWNDTPKLNQPRQ